MKFRKDINGLRAIAVIAVVIFHFESTWLPGGFAGVDVFFVISGFLMTGIIFNGFARQQFSVVNFYIARANRIIPALAVLCISLLIFGWFFLVPTEYANVGKHVLSSITFLSNIIYWKESGYFEAASHEKWLLHTWSLSVEWQFYILYPLVLVILKRFFSLNSLRFIILLGAVSGFFISAALSEIYPNPSYYLMPMRSWEMLLGGVAFLFPFTLAKRTSQALEVIGFGLILISYLTIDSRTIWPGYAAIMPVLGAFAVILAQRNDSFISGNLLFQKLGLWSYSIYLWHWPIVVFVYSYSLSFVFIFIGIGLSVFIGFLSHKYVESFRFKREFPSVPMAVTAKPIQILCATGLIGWLIYNFDGIAQEFRAINATEQAKYVAKYHRSSYKQYLTSAYSQQCNFFDTERDLAKTDGISDDCYASTGGIFIWGDSHAQSLSYGIRQLFKDTAISQVTSSACKPSLREETYVVGQYKVACDRSNEAAQKAILAIKPDVILLAQQTDHDKNDFNEIKDFLEKHGLSSKLVLVGPAPQWKPSLPNAIVKRHFDKAKIYIDDPSFLVQLQEIDSVVKHRYSDSSILFVSLLDELCNLQGCMAKVDNENTPLMWDYGHLTLEGSTFVAESILVDALSGNLKPN